MTRRQRDNPDFRIQGLSLWHLDGFGRHQRKTKHIYGAFCSFHHEEKNVRRKKKTKKRRKRRKKNGQRQMGQEEEPKYDWQVHWNHHGSGVLSHVPCGVTPEALCPEALG